MHSSTSLAPFRPSATPLPYELSTVPRPAAFVHKVLEKERLAIVTHVLFFLVLPAIAWIVLARGLHSPWGALALAGAVAVVTFGRFVGAARVLFGATRLVRDGLATKGRIVGRRGFLLEAIYVDPHGAAARALFLPTLLRNQGQSIAILHLPEREELVAVTERGIVAGIKEASFAQP